MQSLAGYWSDFLDNCRQPPYIHPKDVDDEWLKDYLEGNQNLRDPLSFNAFLESPRFDPKDELFHFSLLPVPYAGDLEKADVFILLLNPSLAPSDYYGEYEHQAFRRALQQSLEQDFRDVEYPFLYLNPLFCWHHAYRWWEAKLRDIVQAVAEEQHRGSYLAALKAVSRRVVAIDLVPYHSAHFSGGSRMINLPSAEAARDWVHRCPAVRAKEGEAVIVVARQCRVWGLEEIEDRIVCYNKSEARAAHLTSNSRGGEAILKHLRSKS
ncbi:MAG TPA: hypothetical protein VFF95_21770 [Candidatus Binatus sp.]|jgi:hypothetical protein|nr:hypothetical protein [Candidatus Binatus sp.]